MDKNLILALKKMGYREMGNDTWGKPVGFHLFVVYLLNNEVKLQNYIKGEEKTKVLTFSMHTVQGETWLESIKFAESRARIDHTQQSSFEFLTREQEISELF